MKSATLDKLIWPAIFVGIVLTGFGLSLPDDASATRWTVITIGGVLVLVGIVLIGLRSRIKD